MVISHTPNAADLLALNIKFANKVTFKSIASDKAKIQGLGNEAFTRSLALGGKYIAVKEWWKAEGKALFAEKEFTTNWDEAVRSLTSGTSRAWFNKLIQAHQAAEASPEVLAAYQAAEEEKDQEWNVERFIAYAKDDANSAPGEEVEVGDVREVNGGSEKSKGNMLGQMRMTGCSDDVYLNKSMEVETKAEDRDIMVMLAVWKDRLAAAGMKGAASMIKVPTKVDEVTGESVKDEAVQYING
jgi:hypothetical protein